MFFLLLFLFFNIQQQHAQIFDVDSIEIKYEKFVLPNGLTLLVYEDHKAPIVAVNVWYHVGSKNEKPGKSGFAHLFEHLMFNGSENFDDDYFQAIERIGGTDVNGTTNRDRTNYFQNIPVAALDQVLFLESDRMGHLLGAVDQELLDEQRGVVQNEKRQGENQPYGQQWNYITKAMYPPGHPYSWTVIGEMEDLNAASLEDVHEWFKAYYGAANATIAIAGDIEPEEAYEKVLKYFGDIPSGPTIGRQEVNIPVHNENTYQVYEDRISEARVVNVWNTPQLGNKEDIHFDLIAAILGSGKNSRLYKKLVYEDQIASDVQAYQASGEIASLFVAQANVKPGAELKEVEEKLLKEIQNLAKFGPTDAELKRVKAELISNFIKGQERIGGFGGVSDILASNETYHEDADYYKKTLRFIEDASAAEIQATAEKWLNKGRHTLIAKPFPDYKVQESVVDRSSLPELGEQKPSKFPLVERDTLSNGMNIVLAKREGVPTVIMDLLFNAGYKTDYLSSPGTAALAMNVLDEGTSNLTSLQINEKLQLLGADLSTGSDMDFSNISLRTLKPSLDESMLLFSDIILNPSFPEKEFSRLKEDQLNTIKREKSQPIGMALRVINKYLYGEDHPYSVPYTGTGYEETVAELERDDVLKFYEQWLRPNNATLVVTGDVDMEDLKSKLENTLGTWKAAEVPEVVFDTPKPGPANTLYLIDRPGSQQSLILAGHLTGKYGEYPEIAVEQMINILGGEFTSRINMNLREDKHWSYGAGGFVLPAKNERPFLVYAPVQTDKSAESVVELKKELREFVTSRPVTLEEVEKVKTNRVLGLPGQWETNAAVNGSLANLVKYDLPDDYYEGYDESVRKLSLEEVKQVSLDVVKPDQVSWFIVGDKAKIGEALDALDFDQIVELDAGGNLIKSPIPVEKEELKN